MHVFGLRTNDTMTARTIQQGPNSHSDINTLSWKTTEKLELNQGQTSTTDESA